MHFDKQQFLDEVNSIVGSVYDRFYLDEKIDLFLEKMKQLVESRPPSFAEFVEDLSKEGFNMNFKLLNNEKQLWKSAAPKIFYRLGESMKNRKIREEA